MICTCARQMYHNNHDGTRDYKTVGDLRCKKCRGHGRCVQCPDCTGAGLKDSNVCPRCFGSGSVPARKREP